MFYKGMRMHYRIPIARTHSDTTCASCPSSVRVTSFIVSVDRGNRRFFLEFSSSDEFEQWYTKLAPEEKTMNEVIVSDARKLIIDIDDPEDYKLANILSFYDFEVHLTSRIQDVFMALGIGNPQIIIYDMCDDYKISYHAVITNFIFSASTCKGLCMIIASGQIWDKCVDVGVYKTVQSVRVEGSTKYGEHRCKNRANNHHLPFASGLLSDTNKTTKSHITCKINRHFNTYSEKEKCCFQGNIDLSQFKVGKLNNNLLPLYRIKPGFCIQCNRIHDRENAAIKYGYNGIPFYICWRKYTTN